MTLSLMLLPLLHSLTDYSFLTKDTNFIIGRFLHAHATHHKDSNEPLSPGFILFALHLKAKILNGIITCTTTKDALKHALSILNFPISTCMQITMFPDKFLYPELLTYLKGQSSDMVELLVTVLSKMNILTDPGSLMRDLESALSQHSKIGKLLAQIPRIKLSLPLLIVIL